MGESGYALQSPSLRISPLFNNHEGKKEIIEINCFSVFHFLFSQEQNEMTLLLSSVFRSSPGF